MLGALVRLLVVVAAVVAAGPARAQLCAPAADPCVVASGTTIAGGTVIDLGTRDLVIAASQTLTVQGTGTGSLTISAGDITLEQGARIVAPGVNGTGGAVALFASGAVTMRLNSRIDVTGGAGGDLTIISNTAVLDGQLRAVANNREADGGFVTILTAGNTSVAGGGFIATGGNGFGFGGDIDVVADGDLTVSAMIEAKGGDGGDISLEAGGDLRVQPGGELNNLATSEGGYGGDTSFAAGGIASVAGPVLTRGAGSLLEGGGDGGSVDFFARSVFIGAQIEMTGAGPDGAGGFLDITADADVTLAAPLLLTGAAQGAGGDVLIDTAGTVTVTSSIDARGGYAGGSFEPATRGSFVLAAGAVVSVGAIPGFALGGFGGDAIIEACSATIAGTLDASGLTMPSRALVQVIAGGALTVSGTLKGPNGVIFTYRTQPPTIMPSAVMVPAPTLIPEPNLPCCVLCTTTTSTSSTTSTSDSSTTTTSTTTTTVSTVPLTSTSVTSPSSSSSSSSTVTTLASSTTSTSLPLSCLDEPLAGYAAVECALTHLQDLVGAQSEDALGGRKSAKRLAGKVAKTWDLVEKSRTSPRAVKLLVKAEKKVVSFETQIARLLAKAKIEDGLATDLLDLSDEISVRISGVLTPPGN